MSDILMTEDMFVKYLNNVRSQVCDALYVAGYISSVQCNDIKKRLIVVIGNEESLKGNKPKDTNARKFITAWRSPYPIEEEEDGTTESE